MFSDKILLNMEQLTPVQRFYEGKTVFITGASGFMGKVLLEKLLYACHPLKEVIIIVRAKRGKTPETRFEEMFKLPVSGPPSPSWFKLPSKKCNLTISYLTRILECVSSVRDVGIVFHPKLTFFLP